MMTAVNKTVASIVFGTLFVTLTAWALILGADRSRYRPEQSPEATVHNYLIAFYRPDAPRAHGYLSTSVVSAPASSEEFASQMRLEESADNTRAPQTYAIALEPATFLANGDAVVRVHLKRFNGSPFDFISGTAGERIEGVYPEVQWWMDCNYDVECQIPFPQPPNKFFTRSFNVRLQQEVEGWRIVYAEAFWLPCWGDEAGCDAYLLRG